VPLSGRIEESFGRRVAALPAQSQRLVLLAAADPAGDSLLVWRAAGRLGIPVQAATPPAEAGLVEFGARVVFRHPLVRSAIYQSASLQERQRVHRALAEATDPDADPDRRAWHRAQAASGPDESVAEELERSADRAQGRGGVAAAAAFLERAAALTPEPARRAQRLLAAARAKRDAGAMNAALGLLASVEAGPRDALRTAQVEHLRGGIAAEQRRSRDAARLLLSAARRFEPLNAGLARETYLEALTAGSVPCSATATTPTGTTASRSSGWAAPGSAPNSPAATCSTASGCAASAAAWTRAISCARRTRCWTRWASRRSPGGPAASCGPPARPSANAPSTPAPR